MNPHLFRPFLLSTTLPGLTLLSALIFAPWFWGCTWPLGIRLLEVLLFSATGVWAVGILLGPRTTAVSSTLSLAVLGLLLQGWFMVLNGHGTYDAATGLFMSITSYLPRFPGSVDQNQSRDAMLRITALLGALVIPAWLGRSRFWRRRLAWAIVASAASITLLGCWQRVTHATDIFWNTSRHLDFFFATYRNVTNAGEYLNLALPLAGALTLAAIVSGRQPWPVAAGVVSVALLLTGSVVCGSKIAPLVSAFSVLLFATMNRAILWPLIERMNFKTRALVLLIVAVILGAIVQSVGLDITTDRWGRIFSDHDGRATLSHRLLVDRACTLACPDAGLTGFGPGTFREIFPFYSWQVKGDLGGVWRYAHNDYLQTELEWGLVGSALWSICFFGGGTVVAQDWWRATGKTEDRLFAAGLLQAQLAVGLMALLDFPLQIASIQLAVTVVLGLAWSSSRWPRRVASASKGISLSTPSGLAILLAPPRSCPTIQVRTVS